MASRLVTAEYVNTSLKSGKRLALLHAANGFSPATKNLETFKQEHIKNGKLFEVGNLVVEGKGRKKWEIAHPLDFQNYARKLGINKDTHVILYNAEDDANGMAIKWATYVYWAFKVYGHENVSIMDGGLSKWKELQFETETSNGQPKSEENGNFQAKWVPEYIASTDDLVNVFEKSQKNVPKYSIVDTRSPKEFGGEKDKPESKYGGRIKDAINITMGDVYDDKTKNFKPESELKQIFQQKGVSPDRPVMLHCSVGLRATVVWVALQIAGYEATVYDGSWVEFSHTGPDNLKIISDQ